MSPRKRGFRVEVRDSAIHHRGLFDLKSIASTVGWKLDDETFLRPSSSTRTRPSGGPFSPSRSR